MNFLLKLVLLFGAVVAALPWLNFSLDEAGLREDAKAAPELSRSGTKIQAHLIAHHLTMAAKERGFEVLPDGLQVEVSAAKAVGAGVPGGGMNVPGAQPLSTQQVTIHMACERSLYGFISRRVEFTTHTQGLGNAGASVFPEAGQETGRPDSAEVAAPTE